MTVHSVADEKIAETSSKGNQEKWQEGGRWYKLDRFGYEALAETVISSLLERSNIERDTLFRFTRYRMERMNVCGRDRTGYSSANFLKPGQSIITLSHLLKRQEHGLWPISSPGFPATKRGSPTWLTPRRNTPG
ncbi:MAG: hypothetical protein Q4C45_04220 [Oscillospiraceae bacterium]|nr:hypothetical protein [Oscillospiraceae bacterium]